jgi:uncharacterized protein (DUF1800 family)
LALILASLFCALSLMTGCGGASIDTADQARFTALSSSAATVRVNQQVQFTNNGLKLGSKMTFYVDGIQGGNTLLGTVDGNGLYTAPAIVPVPNSVTVTANSVDHPTFPQGTASVSVLNPIPVISAVTPSTFPEGTAQIAVNGSQFVFGAQIMWNGVAVPTTLISSTQLVANIPAPSPGTFPLLVSNPDPGAANSATVPVVVGPGKVVLTLYPGDGSDVRVGNPISFSLAVNGTINTGVTLQINGIPNGNAQVGTVVSNSNGNITYTAPLVLPTPSNVVQLSITSVDNPAVSITQNISVLNPIPILNSASPMNFNVGPPTTTVVVTGQNFINGAQVLMNGAPVPTTFNSGTQLTATLSPTEPGNLDLKVLNPSPGPSTSADLIALVNGTPPVPLVTPEDASRFLEQATFGATDDSIHHLSLIGFQAWLNEQFALPPTPQEPAVETAVILNNPPCASGDVTCNAALFEQNSSDEGLVQGSFWQQALSANDQLRQRIVYSLTEMYVVSSAADFNIQSMPRGEASYYDLLGQDAFGNYRTLLQDITLNPMMGQMLSMLGNDKGNATTDPDENYAREVMQLFNIGLYQLNDDGSQKLDSTGNPIPTYSNTDVEGLAAVFTGFSWNIPGNNTDTAWSNCCAYVGPGFGEELLPMQSFASHHSTVQKQFLGVTIPASGVADPDGDLKIALDTLFNHPNLPAFFCRQMIEHLVTSNPSPTYIGNCSAVFKDNGMGVRGDLKAVFSEILLDPEARNSATDFSNPQYGKVREALLRYTEWARAFSAQSRSGSYGIGSTEDPIWGLGQMSLRSPTVFNWFAPGYVPPGTSIEAAGLVGPEFQMTNVSTVVGYLNFMQDSIGSDANNGFDLFASYETEIGLASNPTALLDRINLLLMAGEMDSTLYSQILAAITAIQIPTGSQTAVNAALANRVRTAIYLTMASPAFNAQY